MSDFAGMEDLLQDFLVEAGDLLSGVDNKLVDLERAPGDKGLLNDIFRGFHTIKGGAGFLNATELVSLCHLTENLFDKLRNGELEITPEVMDVILFSTAAVRDMFDSLEQGTQPAPADPSLMDKLRDALAGELGHGDTHVERMPPVVEAPAPAPAPAAPAPAAAPVMVASPVSVTDDGPDWDSLFEAVTGTPVAPPVATAPAAAALPVAPPAAAPVAMHQSDAELASKTPEEVIKAADERGIAMVFTGARHFRH